jgi:hypothetical protein
MIYSGFDSGSGSKNYRTLYRDPRSGIRKKPIPDPGYRGQKGAGSRIRIRITMMRIRMDLSLYCGSGIGYRLLFDPDPDLDYYFMRIRIKLYSLMQIGIRIWILASKSSLRTLKK